MSMDDAAARLLIPGEEVTLLFDAVDEALELARTGQVELGRLQLHRGLRSARTWRNEEWGDALTHLWLQALCAYNARNR
jgi:hypothetical protein